MEKQRLTTGEVIAYEKSLDLNVRPKAFKDFLGQKEVKEKLEVFIRASQQRKESLEHILFCGPPGLGKTTLSHIVAETLNTKMVVTSGPALLRKGDLVAILTNLEERSVLFIDEIHRLPLQLEEYLYIAMEDFVLDLITGEGPAARAMRFQLPYFTLIGATTRTGLLKAPFRNRFGIVEHLSFYKTKELVTILQRSSQILKINLNPEGAYELALRSRGTPRIANRLLRRVRDYAQVKGQNTIDKDITCYALKKLSIDNLGLDHIDRKILRTIRDKFKGGPVGIGTLSSALNEEPHTLEEVYEPFLIKEGFLEKTPRGRALTSISLKHLQKNDLI